MSLQLPPAHSSNPCIVLCCENLMLLFFPAWTLVYTSTFTFPNMHILYNPPAFFAHFLCWLKCVRAHFSKVSVFNYMHFFLCNWKRKKEEKPTSWRLWFPLKEGKPKQMYMPSLHLTGHKLDSDLSPPLRINVNFFSITGSGGCCFSKWFEAKGTEWPKKAA